jgi:dihydropteroate synthase
MIFAPRPEFEIASRGRVLRLGADTLVMGIVNVTPDSFSDGMRFLEPEAAAAEALRQAEDGAAIVDIGGESTRPGSDDVPEEDEIRRVLPVIERLRSAGFPAWISIDTTKHEVARLALDAGADLLNDVSGLRFDPRLAALAAGHGVPMVLMHSRERPKTMQAAPRYDDLVAEVTAELRSSLAAAERAGVPASAVILDPGIGFAKTAAHSLEILGRLPELARLGRPLLVGPSRKSFLGAVLDRPVGGRLEGTLAAVALAAAAGAHIVRVHDVAEARRAVGVADAVRRAVGEGAAAC